MKKSIITFFSLLIGMFSVLLAQEYIIQRSIISGGGNTISNPSYTLKNSIGQPTVGKISNFEYTSYPGFWHPIYVEPLPPGWTQLESMPTNIAGKYVKDGGALVGADESKSGVILYAFRGNKSKQFFKYDAGWTPKETLLYGTKPPPDTLKINKKGVGKGASMCYDGDHTIYATKGNGTRELWAYDMASDAGWTAKAFVPVPKALKGGTSIVYLNGKVYLLAGGQKKTDLNNFYVYNTTDNTWTTGPSIALGVNMKPFKDGSCITELNGDIYALKAGDKGNYFYKYDTTLTTWSASDSMPLWDSLYGKYKKKLLVKDGAAMANDGSTIYVVKGGGTNVMWTYIPIMKAGWTRSDSIPRLNKKSVVKTGGAMAYANEAVYLLKGNNTPEFWRYVSEEKSKVKGQRSNLTENVGQVLSLANLKVCPTISVVPNPFSKQTTIQYAVPISGKVSIKLYNTNGRLIEIMNDGYINAGTYTMNFNAKNLANGIYFLQYEDRINRTEIKLIVK